MNILKAEYKDITELKKQIADCKKNVHSLNRDYMTGYICALSVVEGIIAGLPTVDGVMGEWILLESGVYGVFDIYKCSVCGERRASDDIDKVIECPKCGAKMGGRL